MTCDLDCGTSSDGIFGSYRLGCVAFVLVAVTSIPAAFFGTIRLRETETSSHVDDFQHAFDDFFLLADAFEGVLTEFVRDLATLELFQGAETPDFPALPMNPKHDDLKRRFIEISGRLTQLYEDSNIALEGKRVWPRVLQTWVNGMRFSTQQFAGVSNVAIERALLPDLVEALNAESRLFQLQLSGHVVGDVSSGSVLAGLATLAIQLQLELESQAHSVDIWHENIQLAFQTAGMAVSMRMYLLLADAYIYRARFFKAWLVETISNLQNTQLVLVNDFDVFLTVSGQLKMLSQEISKFAAVNPETIRGLEQSMARQQARLIRVVGNVEEIEQGSCAPLVQTYTTGRTRERMWCSNVDPETYEQWHEATQEQVDFVKAVQAELAAGLKSSLDAAKTDRRTVVALTTVTWALLPVVLIGIMEVFCANARISHEILQQVRRAARYQAKQQFVEYVCRELRSPLAAMMSSLATVRRQKFGVPPSLQQSLSTLERSMHRVEQLAITMNSVADTTSTTETKSTSIPVRTDIARLLRGLIRQFQVEARVPIRAHVVDGFPKEVVVDRTQLRRVLAHAVQRSVHRTTDGIILLRCDLRLLPSSTYTAIESELRHRNQAMDGDCTPVQVLSVTGSGTNVSDSSNNQRSTRPGISNYINRLGALGGRHQAICSMDIDVMDTSSLNTAMVDKRTRRHSKAALRNGAASSAIKLIQGVSWERNTLYQYDRVAQIMSIAGTTRWNNLARGEITTSHQSRVHPVFTVEQGRLREVAPAALGSTCTDLNEFLRSRGPSINHHENSDKGTRVQAQYLDRKCGQIQSLSVPVCACKPRGLLSMGLSDQIPAAFPELSAYHVLIVTIDSFDIGIAQRCLDTALMALGTGCTTKSANDGRTLIQAAKEAQRRGRPFDFILTEIDMVDMDGDAALQILRDEGHAIPSIAMRSEPAAEQSQEGLFTAELHKPFSSPAMCKAVKQLVESGLIRRIGEPRLDGGRGQSSLLSVHDHVGSNQNHMARPPNTS